MEEKIKKDRYIMTAVVTGCLSVIPGFLTMLFLTLGVVFSMNPYDANITVNGVTLQGQEAAAAALRYGKIFLGIGCVSLAIVVALIIVCLIFLFKGLKKR